MQIIRNYENSYACLSLEELGYPAHGETMRPATMQSNDRFSDGRLVQWGEGRFGIKSNATSVDIENWVVLGTVGVHFLGF